MRLADVLRFWLLEQIADRGMSQKKLASQLGWSEEHLSRVLHVRRRPPSWARAQDDASTSQIAATASDRQSWRPRHRLCPRDQGTALVQPPGRPPHGMES